MLCRDPYAKGNLTIGTHVLMNLKNASDTKEREGDRVSRKEALATKNFLEEIKRFRVGIKLSWVSSTFIACPKCS